MTMTQFAMVEELASIIKDNLYCKHLVLSVEEVLVNFIQDDSREYFAADWDNGVQLHILTGEGNNYMPHLSMERVLELQPMSPYHRLLLHRLADIYGFAHESVGDGDDRHLVLERCPETAIPSILVSDILWQHDSYESPNPAHHILKRKEAPELKQAETLPSSTTFEEREAAYLAARERIFSLHESEEKEFTAPKSRNIPVIARRMIAHALGTRISCNYSDQKPLIDARVKVPGTNEKGEESAPSCSDYSKESTVNRHLRENKASERKGSSGKVVSLDNLEREQRGAAKRLFAHALGLTSSKVNQSSTTESTQGNKSGSQDL